MSTWLHATLMFGIDYGKRPPRVVTVAAEETGLGDDSKGCTIGTPDDSAHRILYVPAWAVPITALAFELREDRVAHLAVLRRAAMRPPCVAASLSSTCSAAKLRPGRCSLRRRLAG